MRVAGRYCSNFGAFYECNFVQKENDQDAYIRDSNCSVLLYVQLLDTVAVSAYKLSTKFANYTQMVSETVDVCKE